MYATEESIPVLENEETWAQRVIDEDVKLSKEDFIAGDLMDEQFAVTFTEGHGGEIGDGIGDDVAKKIRTIPPHLVPKKDAKDVQRTKDLSFSAFYEKTKKENIDITAPDLVNYRLKKE
jgi:hypothetical protein